MKMLRGLAGSCAFGVSLLAFAAAPMARAQDGASASPSRPSAAVSFAFERPGVAVPKFILRIGEDGTGSYKGEEAPPLSPYPGVSSPTEPIDRGLALSSPTAHKIFMLARSLHYFNVACASKAKNIADTGKKTLFYKGPDGEGSCTYNYSENKSVNQLTEIFQGIASTMDEGRRLDHLHRYDRLGLDAAIGQLTQEIADGHALELGTIQTTLRSIADDTAVIERVRTRANSLLALVPVEMRQAGP